MRPRVLSGIALLIVLVCSAYLAFTFGLFSGPNKIWIFFVTYIACAIGAVVQFVRRRLGMAFLLATIPTPLAFGVAYLITAMSGDL